jgi:hypothetical protein
LETATSRNTVTVTLTTGGAIRMRRLLARGSASTSSYPTVDTVGAGAEHHDAVML